MLALAVLLKGSRNDGPGPRARLRWEALHPLQHRHEKDESRNVSRDRIARYAQHALGTEPTVEEGLSRPHGDLPKFQFEPFRLQCGRNQVPLTNRRAADGEE